MSLLDVVEHVRIFRRRGCGALDRARGTGTPASRRAPFSGAGTEPGFLSARSSDRIG
jgi:hypothetical protein